MSETTRQDNNNRYISDALEWLRLVLLRRNLTMTPAPAPMTPAPIPITPAPIMPDVPPKYRFSLWWRTPPILPSPALITPNTLTDDVIEKARHEMEEEQRRIEAAQRKIEEDAKAAQHKM